MECLSSLYHYPVVINLQLLFPMSHSQILETLRKHIRVEKSLNSSATTLKGPGDFNTVVIFDAIASMPGVKMPWKEMVQICKDEGVWSLVDAAHSLGQEMNVDLAHVDPDFWVAVSHFVVHVGIITMLIV